MQKLQPVRGTKDILPDEHQAFSHVANTTREIAGRFGFAEMATPIFEFTEVFKRTLGDTSDVVSKEMYTFEDKGGESITLRPETTASIARAYISNGLQQHAPCKLFAIGPQFRYERPQKGRYRQFHQVSVEHIGAKEPEADVEIITLAAMLIETLGITDITLELNSLGDTESRTRYRTALVEYLSDYEKELSEDSKTRLSKNPLRILDSKDAGDKAIIANAPLLYQHYTNETADFFAAVQEGLDAVGISYTTNPKLVRGLDYYCHTAFEFTTNALGSQNAVFAGGRYDGLIKTMGGADTPAVGWAVGIERLMMLTNTVPEAPRPIALIPIGEAAEEEARKLAYSLRKEGFRIEYAYSGNLGKRMKKANKANARLALIFGEEELEAKTITIKQMDEGTEESIAITALYDKLISS